MQEATLNRMLNVTRDVFEGRINRVQLARQPSTAAAVFVGTAIMWACRESYLDSNDVVRGSYTQMLEHLLSAGVVNRLAHEVGYKTGHSLAASAHSMRLYVPIWKRENSKLVKLDLPSELIALVQKLGCTNHIRTFLQDAEEGVARQAQWVKAYREKFSISE